MTIGVLILRISSYSLILGDEAMLALKWEAHENLRPNAELYRSRALGGKSLVCSSL